MNPFHLVPTAPPVRTNLFYFSIPLSFIFPYLHFTVYFHAYVSNGMWVYGDSKKVFNTLNSRFLREECASRTTITFSTKRLLNWGRFTFQISKIQVNKSANSISVATVSHFIVTVNIPNVKIPTDRYIRRVTQFYLSR